MQRSDSRRVLGGGAPAEARQRQAEPAALQEAVEGISIASKAQSGRKENRASCEYVGSV